MSVPVTSTTLLRVLGSDANSPRWTEFTDRYLPVMSGFLQRYFPSVDAEEVLQESLIALVRKLPEYRYVPDKNGHFRNYLIGLVRYKAMEHLRQRQVQAVRRQRVAGQLALDAEERARGKAKAEEDAARQVRQAVYEVALQQLLADPKIQDQTKQIFRSVALEGQSPDVVARTFGVSRNNVDQIKNRLIGRLRQLVEGLRL